MDLIRTRPAREDEVARVVELWRELMEYHVRLDPRFRTREGAAATFESFARHNSQQEAAILLVAEIAGDVVGYCMAAESELPPLFDIGPIAEIYDLAVTERHRRQGIGRRLVEAVCAWARDRSLSRIELRASVRNPAALAFWRSLATPFLETLTIDPRTLPRAAARG
jgi:GNAT superfamily N-acetyltransferase